HMLQKRIFPVHRGGLHRSESLCPDLFEYRRCDVLKRESPEAFGPRFAVSQVVSKRSLVGPCLLEALTNDVPEEPARRPWGALRARALNPMPLRFPSSETLRADLRPMDVTMRAGPANPPVTSLAAMRTAAFLRAARIHPPEHASAAGLGDFHVRLPLRWITGFAVGKKSLTRIPSACASFSSIATV